MSLRRWSVAVIIVVVSIGSLAFIKFQQVQAAIAFGESFPEPSTTVETLLIQSSNYQPTYQVTGQVRAIQVVTLHNQLPGTIEKINYIAGGHVEQGQLLISLNTSGEQAKLQAANASFKLAKATLERNKKLLDGNKVSQQLIDSALADYQVSRANIASLESVISKKQVVAPFSGTMGLETYEVGQFLNANASLTTLVDDNQDMWVDFKLPQTMDKLSLDSHVAIKKISKSTKPQVMPATVIAKNSQMDAARHLTYRAQINASRQLLSHNELVKVVIPTTPEQVVMVPNSAIVRSPFGSFVFELIKDEQGQYRAKKRDVELGQRDGNNHVVRHGLESGMLIATIGAFKLRPYLLVYIEQANKAAPMLADVAGVK
ncbi:MAG: efflux RND transporter periplasmic adaptor subunit [Gammaproteobacteria bacterium]|nr:efflux RND transporter periplasmic adaptor subunit [Gammaproteobacteria bacterium]